MNEVKPGDRFQDLENGAVITAKAKLCPDANGNGWWWSSMEDRVGRLLGNRRRYRRPPEPGPEVKPAVHAWKDRSCAWVWCASRLASRFDAAASDEWADVTCEGCLLYRPPGDKPVSSPPAPVHDFSDRYARSVLDRKWHQRCSRCGAYEGIGAGLESRCVDDAGWRERADERTQELTDLESCYAPVEPPRLPAPELSFTGAGGVACRMTSTRGK